MSYSWANAMEKFQRPLQQLEFVVYITVVVGTVVGLLDAFLIEDVVKTSIFPTIIDRYEIVTIILVIMSVMSALAVGAMSGHETEKRLWVRRRSLFTITVGLAFLASLSIITAGFLSVTWVLEVSLAVISAILYVGLKYMSTRE